MDLKWFATSLRHCLLRMCCCHSGPSAAGPVVTIFTNHCSSSSLCQSGRRAIISLYPCRCGETCRRSCLCRPSPQSAFRSARPDPSSPLSGGRCLRPQLPAPPTLFSAFSESFIPPLQSHHQILRHWLRYRSLVVRHVHDLKCVQFCVSHLEP